MPDLSGTLQIRTRTELARIIDHTLLKPESREGDIIKLCAEAREFGFWAVCIAPCWVPLARKSLVGTGVRLATVIGFPHGNTFPLAKVYEAERAIAEGADELDMVINIGFLRSGRHSEVSQEIESVVKAAHYSQRCIVKVIIETALLTCEEKIEACKLALRASADFVKTSTGFASAGASSQDVVLMRTTVGLRMGIKAAGGIRDLQIAQELIRSGATRLGCSASVDIVKGLPEHIEG